MKILSKTIVGVKIPESLKNAEVIKFDIDKKNFPRIFYWKSE